VRSGRGEARTILLLHIMSVRPSKQPLMVRTFLKVYMELGSYFLFLQEQIKDIIIIGPHTRHIIAVNGALSSPNITALCCSNAGNGRFFVSASAIILLVLHCTSLMVWSLTSWSGESKLTHDDTQI
jgi:hypothetical protein